MRFNYKRYSKIFLEISDSGHLTLDDPRVGHSF